MVRWYLIRIISGEIRSAHCLNSIQERIKRLAILGGVEQREGRAYSGQDQCPPLPRK